MVYFRTDSNDIISGGHVMRCLAIAEALCDVGEKVCFLVADENPVPVLKNAGIPYINLHSDWQDLMTDIEKVQEVLMNDVAPILLIDTYKITETYIKRLKPYCKIVYLGSKLENLGNPDLLINYSTDIDYQYYYETYGEKTKLLLGSSFAPLRKEFQEVSPKYREKTERILITTGNTDRSHITLSIVSKLLAAVSDLDIILDIVVGRMFEDKDQLHKMYGASSRVILHENITSMSILMRNCDLAVSANGTTVYELSAMGVPVVSFAMVEEQLKSAESLGKLGVIDYCGCSYLSQEKCIELIADRVQFYITHNFERVQLAKKAHELIDGNGCKRIIDVLLGVQSNQKYWIRRPDISKV